MAIKRHIPAGQQRQPQKDLKGPALARRPETPADDTWPALTQLARLLAHKAASEYFEEADTETVRKSSSKSDEDSNSARTSLLRPDTSGDKS